jgi:hypothetical protein
VSILASPFSGATGTIIDVAIALGALFWIGLGYWTFRDAQRRIEEPLLVGLATILGLFPPFIGPLIYMLFRPPEFIDDRRERELEIRAIESRLAQADHSCPVCTTKLKQACSSCNAPLEPIWQVCPYCETPMQMMKSGAPPALGTRRVTATARRRPR